MAWLAVAYTDVPSPNLNVIIAMQVQVLATLGSLSGISYPSRIQAAISVAKLANLDLVRSARTVQQAFRCSLNSSAQAWFGSAPGSSSSGLHCTFAHRLLHEQHFALRLADGHRALQCGHSRIGLGLATSCIVRDATARRSRLLRPCGPRADKRTVLRCKSYTIPTRGHVCHQLVQAR